jgi:hypothetical protein
MKEIHRMLGRDARRKLLQEAHIVHSSAKANANRENVTKRTGGHWSAFREDMRAYFTKDRLASKHPKILEELNLLVDALHADGEKVLMADVLGEADATSLEADETHCFALTKSRKSYTDRIKTTTGNAFDKLAQNEFLASIDLGGGSLAFCVLNPVGGLYYLIEDDKSVNTYAVLRLSRLLVELYKRLSEGGMVVIVTTWMNRPTRNNFLQAFAKAGVPVARPKGSELMILKKPEITGKKPAKIELKNPLK